MGNSAIGGPFMPLKLRTQVEICIFFVLLMFCLQEDIISCHDAQEVDWHDLKKEGKSESTGFNFQCSLQGKKK